MDQGDETPSGEAWEPEDEAGGAAWDDGSGELWDEAETVKGESERGFIPNAPDGDEAHTALPPKVEAWRKRSATGAILTGFAFGLQQVFEPKEEPAVIMETSGDPPRDLPVEADLEYGRPRHSVVNIRPWLLPGEQTPVDQTPVDQTPVEQPRGEREPAEHQEAGGKATEEDRDPGRHEDGAEP